MAAKKGRPCGKVVPITMGPSIKAFSELHSKGVQHKGYLRYGKVVMEYFPQAAPTGSHTRTGHDYPRERKAASAGRRRGGSVGSSHYGCPCTPRT